MREVLAGAGANEAWTNTFLSDIDLVQAGLDPSVALEVENPLDRSQRLLRTSLLPGLLNAARFNIERQAGAFSLFELGSVFRSPAPGYSGVLIEGVMEWEQLGLLAVGAGVDGGHLSRPGRSWPAGLRPDRLLSVGSTEAWTSPPTMHRRHGAVAGAHLITRLAGPYFRGRRPRR